MLFELYLAFRCKNCLKEFSKQTVNKALRCMQLQDWTVTVHVVDDEEIEMLNAEHRGKLSATDVLSFPVSAILAVFVLKLCGCGCHRTMTRQYCPGAGKCKFLFVERPSQITLTQKHFICTTLRSLRARCMEPPTVSLTAPTNVTLVI